MSVTHSSKIEPFSEKSRTPTVAEEIEIGLCGVVEADFELFCNCWSAGFLGERLYNRSYCMTQRDLDIPYGKHRRRIQLSETHDSVRSLVEEIHVKPYA